MLVTDDTAGLDRPVPEALAETVDDLTESPFPRPLQAILLLEESELMGIVARSQVGQAQTEEPRRGPASASQLRKEFPRDLVSGSVGFKRICHRP